MSRHWTEKHDAHIASVVEGAKAKKERGIPERLWKWTWPSGKTTHLHPYNTDIAAAFRALEAWRFADKENREYVLYSPAPNDGSGKLVVISHGRQYWSTLADLPAAIAWALYDATGGPQ